MSEAVVEREFSKMKLTPTDKRTRLSLDPALGKRNTGTRSSATKVETWKRQLQRRIFSKDI